MTAETATIPDPVECVCGTKPFMSVEAAATVLDVSEEYLYSGLRTGRFPGVSFGRSYRLRRGFVRDFVGAPSGTRFEEFAAAWIAREAQAVAS